MAQSAPTDTMLLEVEPICDKQILELLARVSISVDVCSSSGTTKWKLLDFRAGIWDACSKKNNISESEMNCWKTNGSTIVQTFTIKQISHEFNFVV